MTISWVRAVALVTTLALASCGDGGEAGAKAPAKVTAVAKSVPGRDWSQTVVATPEGGFRVGNPDAPVKLLEFASLTCPHCRDFHKAAMETLSRDYIAGGRVSYELRNFVLNGPDFAVTVLARCQGPGPYFKLVDAFYGSQETWIRPFLKIPEADQKRMEGLPPEKQVLALADFGNIDDFMRLRGMPRARYEACLSDKAARDRLEAIRIEAVDRYKLQGTPTFVINGETQPDLHDWPAVEAALKAKLS